LTFAPLIIHIFYSANFIPAYEVLRWQIMGIFLRVVSWPMGFVLLAKGRGKIYFWTELTANVIYIALVWAGMMYFGLKGAGMALFALYVFYTIMMLTVVHHLSNFHWSAINLYTGVMFSLFIALVFLLPLFLPRGIALAVNTVIIIAVSIYSLRKLYRLVGPEWLAAFSRKLRDILGWSRTK
jgi:enterobacterial common antigen flippase